MASTVVETGAVAAAPGQRRARARVGETTVPQTSAESCCTCGQELDCCHRAHCPRCGTTLHD